MKRPLAFALAASLCMAAYQTLWKLGVSQGVFSVFLWAGIALYVCNGVLIILAFRTGDLSMVVPFTGLSYLLVALAAYFFLGESVTFMRAAGMAAIFGGVLLVGK